jgi:hypothetical protein
MFRTSSQFSQFSQLAAKKQTIDWIGLDDMNEIIKSQSGSTIWH